MTWHVIATRKCGCEIAQLDNPAMPNHGEVSERATGPCAYHLCRVCGGVPLADSEPDCLCNDCYAPRPQ
jgi:hypothetical protein